MMQAIKAVVNPDSNKDFRRRCRYLVYKSSNCEFSPAMKWFHKMIKVQIDRYIFNIHTLFIIILTENSIGIIYLEIKFFTFPHTRGVKVKYCNRVEKKILQNNFFMGTGTDKSFSLIFFIQIPKSI